jgi:hypothetical protein
MAGHDFLHVDVGINDLEESKSVFVDVDAAEFSDFIGCVSNKANEVTAEVCMNLRSVDVEKVVSPEGRFPGRQWCQRQYLQGYGLSILW